MSNSKVWTNASLTMAMVACFILIAYPGSTSAQQINIDFGNGPKGNNGDYVGTAASGQGGTWNYINVPMATGVQFPLINADGASTNVRLAMNGGTQVFDPVEATEILVDPELMGEIHWNTPSVTGRFELRGLAPATYHLFLYSYAGDVVNDETVFISSGQTQTVAHIGPADPASHGYLDTFAVFYPVVPDAAGTVRFQVVAGPGVQGVANYWQINGLQLGLGDPFTLPPSLLIDQPVRGTDADGCCVLNWTMRNINPLNPITMWHMEIEAGAGGRLPGCIGTDAVTVGDGWTATYCYPWDMGLGASAPSSRAVVQFTGPPLAPGATLEGTLRVDANGPVSFKEPLPPPVTLPYAPPGNHDVLPRGIHVHVRQGTPDANCANGTFNAHNGLSNGWVTTVDFECLPAFLPVPSFSEIGKGMLFIAVALVGAWLILKRRFSAGL